ncbi:structural maintenance of chromosome 3 (chondroitin sulfate proteoglycan 6) [Nematocida sp. AWRm77]|nr:structural maintenance of chromosome 3 (chondroitin sulfate proteoglycan 6) [Nematocida sp. AWRm77]
MKLKSIVLSNFKSFASRVCLEEIADGVNILVGANGAGKSSILSAIRFVIDAHRRVGPHERKALINENNPELLAYVEIVFDNTDRAFPGEDSVVIRRTVTQKADEYTLDGAPVPREELVSLYESAGISQAMPYFVIEQGKINELAHMGGTARMDLLRELAGSAVYEKDKEESQKVLDASEEVEQKIEGHVATLQEKVASMEKEKAKKAKRAEIDRKRQVLIKELYKRELHAVKARLEHAVSEETFGDDTAADQSEEALKVQLEDVLARLSMHRLEETGRAVRALPDIEKEEKETAQKLQEERARLSALQKELAVLCTHQTFSHVAQKEAHAAALQGPSAVQQQIEALRSQLESAGAGEHAPGHKGRRDAQKEDVLEKRRQMWKKEQELRKRKKQLETQMKDQERAFLVSSKGFALGSELRAIPGVVGYVYDIVAMPWEVLSAVSVACMHLLTSIVVGTREDGLSLVRTCNVTQRIVPLASLPKEKRVADVPATPLSAYISCSEEYADVVAYLFGGVYFAADFESGRLLSKQHRVNVLTAGGEYFSAAGTITGGEDRTFFGFREYIKSKEEYRLCIVEEQKVQKEKHESEKACAEIAAGPRAEDSLQYLRTLLFLLEHPECDLEHLILQKRLALEESSAPSALQERLSVLEQEKKEAAAYIAAQSLQSTAQRLEAKLGRTLGSSLWKEKALEKARLDLKYRRLQKKILSLNPENTERIVLSSGEEVEIERATKDELVSHLSTLKKEINALPLGMGSTEQMGEEYAKIQEKLKELKHAKEKIFEMQKSLETKKEDVINITVSQVKSNFEYFFRKLTHGDAVMHARSTPPHSSLDISASFAGEPKVSSDELSSGQKTVIALCLILSMQRIYEAPFYLMDEFDANLDTHFLQTIVSSGVLKGRQMFLCTFREETLSLGEKFFYVHNNQVSHSSSSSDLVAG